MWVHKGKILEEVPGQGEGPVCVCVCLCCFLLWPDHSQWTKTDTDTGGTREEMAQESSDIGQLHIF